MKKNLSVFVAICLLATLASSAIAAGTIRVGAKNFTEQYVLGHMIAKLLDKAGYDVSTTMGTGSTVTRSALETGQIDLYPEYTGTAWTLYLKNSSVITDPEELYNKVSAQDLEKHQIVWLAPSAINNTYAMAITNKAVETIGSKLSQLAEYVNAHSGELVFGINHEFYERPDGFFAMAEHYGMKVGQDQVRAMETGITFEAMKRGQVDVTMVFATDGKIAEFDLHVLEDDKQFFPVYSLAVSIRKEALDANPGLPDVLAPITKLTDAIMQRLNYEVDVQGKPAEMVAEEYLKEAGLL
jgi:osmoprotectant transport system substrate-binding protein